MVHWGRPTTPAMAGQHKLQLALLLDTSRPTRTYSDTATSNIAHIPNSSIPNHLTRGYATTLHPYYTLLLLPLQTSNFKLHRHALPPHACGEGPVVRACVRYASGQAVSQTEPRSASGVRWTESDVARGGDAQGKQSGSGGRQRSEGASGDGRVDAREV